LTVGQTSQLRELDELDKYDFWRPARQGHTADIMVSPEEFPALAKSLWAMGIEFEDMISDVGSLIKSQKTPKSTFNGKISFDNYYPHEDVSPADQCLTS
jgi:hypothetical protein